MAGCSSRTVGDLAGRKGADIPAYEPENGGPAAIEEPGRTERPGSQEKPGGDNKLVVAHGTDPEELIKRGFAALGGIAAWVKPGHKVVIKPNFSVPVSPETAATTDPRLVAALVRQCLAQGAKEVKVIDHPFTNSAMCLDRTGIKNAVEAAGGKIYTINSLNDKFYRQVKLDGPVLKSVYFSWDALDADLFINFPKLKHHSTTKLTIGLKNMMGLVWDRQALHSSNLDAAIPELTAYKKPHLTIVDATRGIIENGPRGPGRIKENNQVVFGNDPVAVDAYSAELFDHKPADVKHLRIAAEMGLGQLDWTKLPVVRV